MISIFTVLFGLTWSEPSGEKLAGRLRDIEPIIPRRHIFQAKPAVAAQSFGKTDGRTHKSSLASGCGTYNPGKRTADSTRLCKWFNRFLTVRDRVAELQSRIVQGDVVRLRVAVREPDSVTGTDRNGFRHKSHVFLVDGGDSRFGEEAGRLSDGPFKATTASSNSPLLGDFT